jgi:hypothetical protein
VNLEKLVNLEELVRAALARQVSAGPEEAGAYDRFLRHRRRWAWRAAGSAGLVLVLVLALGVGGVGLVTGRHLLTTGGSYTATMVFAVPSSASKPSISPDGAQRLASTYAALLLDDDQIAQAIARKVGRQPADVKGRLTSVNPVNTALIRVTYGGSSRAEALTGMQALEAAMIGPRPVSPVVVPNSVVVVEAARVTDSP